MMSKRKLARLSLCLGSPSIAESLSKGEYENLDLRRVADDEVRIGFALYNVIQEAKKSNPLQLDRRTSLPVKRISRDLCEGWYFLL